MILTLVVALFNLAMIAPMINQMLQQIPQTGRLEGPSYSFEFAVIYILASLGLSVYCSLLLQPKRLVSPFSVQIITGLILALVIAGYAMNPNTGLLNTTMNQTQLQELRPQNPQVLSSLFLLAFVVVTMLPILGLVQAYILRWLVGLNADKELPISGFITPVGLRDLWNILKAEDFTEMYHLFVSKEKDHVLVESDGESRESHIIMAMANKRNQPLNTEPRSSKIAILSYEYVSSTLTESPYARTMHNNIISTLRDKLKEKGELIDLKKSDPIFEKIDSYGRRNTRSRLEQRNISRYVVGGIILTAIMVVLTYYWAIDAFPDEAYFGALVLIAVTVAFEAIHKTKEPPKEQFDLEFEDFE